MSELVLTLLRLGYLALLWVFVLAALAVLRRDIFGTRVTPRGPGRDRPKGRAAPRAPSPHPRTAARTSPSRLVVTQGPLAGTTIPLGPSSILVGRSPSCSLVLDDDYSSNRHARFFPKDGGWWIEDLGSTNGTLVGGARLTEPVEVGLGTPVRIGQTLIELRR